MAPISSSPAQSQSLGSTTPLLPLALQGMSHPCTAVGLEGACQQRMPILISPDIAAQFKKKWLLLHPEDQDNAGEAVTLDDSLTSLQWLQNFSIVTIDPERPPVPSCPLQQPPQQLFQGSEAPASPPAGDTAAKGMPPRLGKPTSTATSPGTSYLPGLGAAEIDYKSNPRVKPPYSYATLICLAVRASKQAKVTLSAIYSWIMENFCYYRHAEPSWQNSIRHNLSLNKCFRKVPRQKDEPGKGGFWEIDPQYADMFIDGVVKRRWLMAAPYSPPWQRPAVPALETKCSLLSPVPHLGDGQPGHTPHQATCCLVHQHSQRCPLLDAPSPLPKRSCPAARTAQSPLLPSSGRDAEALRGEFDWADAFDDVFRGNGSNFEDLDINAALSSLSTEVDLAMQGRYIPPAGKWGAPAPSHLSPGASHWEDFTPFADTPQHPWEEEKGEALSNPWGFEQGFNFCDGFLSEMQPWDKVDTFM
ncbi:forkhead box protein J1-B-like isoform X3 [Gopherus flavomarginatus]|uniref:forkhead box protein J1-B-like isoform X3 n=1 Tax=Gopherus flavomarginatus TaxID=286002 RepID=UPI0021CC0B73|nr:forkhead box protein J1-B-like isoform X3 [Gopherus flavomarginatus]